MSSTRSKVTAGWTMLLLLQLRNTTHSTIIGSSVVTSVSVVMGDDDVTPPTVQTSTTVTKVSTPATAKVVMVLQPNVTEAGVLSVIATLKNIVEEEHLKRQTEPVQPTSNNGSQVTAPLWIGTPAPVPDLDDDEAEAEVSFKPVTTVSSTTVPVSPVPVELLNETADTSAEVHAAIHRLSGALLKPGKKPNKPIEHILTDVLKSIQSEKNFSVLAISNDSSEEPTTTQLPVTSPEPQIGPVVVGSKGHLSLNGQGHSDDEVSVEPETEEDIASSTTLRPRTTRSTVKPGTKKGHPGLTKRPADLYDDEIFGYDPYQTFLHGVYVPHKEAENFSKVPASSSDSVPHHYHVTNLKPPRLPFPTHFHQPITIRQKPKPVPTLPDHLHRPRPSHLEYQHDAADTIDTETGLTTVKVRHPGQKFTNQKQNLEPDRLRGPTQTQMAILRPTTFQPPTVRQSPPTFPATRGTTSARPIFVPTSSSPPRVDHGQPSGSGSPVVKSPVAGPGPTEDVQAGGRPMLAKAPQGNPGLEGTITVLDKEMKGFVDICTRLALKFFIGVTNPAALAVEGSNVVMSPFTVISSLGILFLGARGSTATQLDTLMTLDDQMTFNPHLMYHNITSSFLSQSNTAAAVIRLLIADKNKGEVLDFYKMRVQNFYDARVEEVDYKYAGHLATSIINQMIRAQIQRNSYEMLNGSLPLTGPLTLLTATFFDGQFSGSRDGPIDSLDFIHFTDKGHRQLVNVPAVALRGSFRAGYDESLDVTGVEVPYSSRDISLLLLLPGRAGGYPVGGLGSLKTRLTQTTQSWTGLMRTFMTREPFKVVFPRFRHHSAINLTTVTQRFGLTDMYRPDLAKFKGINGLTDLYLDQNLMHYAELSTYEKLSDTLSGDVVNQKVLRPHVRGEPLSINDWIFLSRSPAHVAVPPLPRSDFLTSLPPVTYTRIRSGKNTVVAEPLPMEDKVIRFERPFLYVLRHNPTGFILMIGQYSDPLNHKQ